MLSWLITPLIISSVLQLLLCGDVEKVKEPDESVCATETCRSVAAETIASMNKCADPCSNFYQFACGRWSASNPKSKYHKGVWDSTELLNSLLKTRLRDELQKEPSTADIIPIRKMKQYYQSCMLRKSGGMQQIREILGETNGWPMIMPHDKWNSHVMNWQDIDNYYFFDLLMESPFYTATILTEASKRFYLVIKPPSFKAAPYENSQSYRSLIMNVAMELIKQDKAEVSQQQLEKDIDDVIAFEKKLYDALMDTGLTKRGRKKSNVREELNPKTIIEEWKAESNEFKKSPIDWEVILQRLLKLANQEDLPDLEHPILFQHTHYFEKLTKIMESTDKRIIVNYMQWKMMSILLPRTTVEFENIFTKYENDVNKAEVKPPRWLDCLEEAGQNHAALYLFIRKYYTDESRKAAKNLFRELVDTYKPRIENTNWLSEETKKELLGKLGLLSDELGHSVFHDDEDNINEYFEELHLGENYVENFVKFVRYQRQRRITYWGKNSKNIDFDNPLNPNTQLSGLNLRLASLYLQNPFLDEKLPKYVSYSMVGTIIGHEISHILDIEELTEMLNDSNNEHGINNLMCFIDAYDKYIGKGKYKSVDGESTLDENVADVNGLQIALQAYQKMKRDRKVNEDLKLPELRKYTDKQMFFILFAQRWCSDGTYDDTDDQHSPNKVRVLGVLSNSVDFAAAFNCPKNSPMNPTEKCESWIQ